MSTQCVASTWPRLCEKSPKIAAYGLKNRDLGHNLYLQLRKLAWPVSSFCISSFGTRAGGRSGLTA